MSFELRIKVVPKSSKNEIVDWKNGELKIRIKGIPEKGKANEMLIQFLAKTLQISKSQIELASGETSRHKKLIISGIEKESVLQTLSKVIVSP